MDTFHIIVTVLTITYSVVFGIVCRKIWEVPMIIDQKLKSHERRLSEKFDLVEQKIEEGESRLDIHDRISSKVYSKEIDSRAISRHGIYPEFKFPRA